MIRIYPSKIGCSEKSSEKILDLIKENENISAQELLNKVGIPSRAIEKQINNLKKNMKIKESLTG